MIIFSHSMPSHSMPTAILFSTAFFHGRPLDGNKSEKLMFGMFC